MEGFQIQATYTRSGHFCADVEFFQPDGSHWGYTTFVMQGREGGQHPLVRHADGRPLMDNGQPQLVRTQGQLDALLAAAPNDTARAAIRRRFSVHSEEDAEGDPLYLELPQGRERLRDTTKIRYNVLKIVQEAATQFFAQSILSNRPVGFDERLPGRDRLKPATRDLNLVTELAAKAGNLSGQQFFIRNGRPEGVR